MIKVRGGKKTGKDRHYTIPKDLVLYMHVSVCALMRLHGDGAYA